MKEYLLGIDIGTSSCKVAVFDRAGAVMASAAANYPVAYPHAGWAEQNPDDWWEGVCRALGELWTKSPIAPADIAAIGVDGQSWSAIALDDSGQVLCPTPIWMDTRAGDLRAGHTADGGGAVCSVRQSPQPDLYHGKGALDAGARPRGV